MSLRGRRVLQTRVQKYTYSSTHGASGYPGQLGAAADGFTMNSAIYPVLYILHGYWETQRSTARDAVGLNVMLGNLWASGEAEEMIVGLR